MTLVGEPVDPREVNLPRWARALLNEERTSAQVAQRKLDAHLKTVQPTRIWHGSYSNPIYLPENTPGDGYTTVNFQMDAGRKLGDTDSYSAIQVRFARSSDQIRALEINGGNSMRLDLMSSNLMYVRLRK